MITYWHSVGTVPGPMSVERLLKQVRSPLAPRVRKETHHSTATTWGWQRKLTLITLDRNSTYGKNTHGHEQRGLRTHRDQGWWGWRRSWAQPLPRSPLPKCCARWTLIGTFLWLHMISHQPLELCVTPWLRLHVTGLVEPQGYSLGPGCQREGRKHLPHVVRSSSKAKAPTTRVKRGSLAPSGAVEPWVVHARLR